MNLKRASGILLHPTSLPVTPGIGTIGKQAYIFIDWMHAAGQSLWQVLPLGPTGYGDSPYASFSTFAGNPLLIDLEMLAGLSRRKRNNPPGIYQNGRVGRFRVCRLVEDATFKESGREFFSERSQWQIYII